MDTPRMEISQAGEGSNVGSQNDRGNWTYDAKEANGRAVRVAGRSGR